ncbi:MAG: carbohydrate ABC transporter permease [Chloroflexota bacterium]
MTRADTFAGDIVRPKPRTTSERLVRLINKAPIHIALAIIGLIWLAPTVGLLVTSFRPRGDIQATGWWEALSTLRFTLENYEQVLTEQGGMLGAFVNSIIISVPSTLLPLLLASGAAYAFSWLSFPFRDTLFLIVVALLMVPVQLAFIPLLNLFRPLGWTQGYLAIWLAHTAYALPFGIFLLRNFFITLPKDLIEAARIDGSSNIGIFRNIVVPLSVPAIAAYGIFQFLWVWNDLLMSLVFVQTGSNFPMTRQIQNLLGQYGTEWHILAAGAFVLMAVPLIVFFSLQRYFVQGLLAGSVK